MSRLFHISENPNINYFQPLPAPSPDSGVDGNAVWAVDERHLVNYLLPRECPRVTYEMATHTKDSDKKIFFKNHETSQRVILVENTWVERINTTDLYIYEFNTENFKLLDEKAGYYISRKTENFLSCKKVNSLIEELKSRNVILKTLPNLWDMIDKVAASTLEFSIIRKRNALPRL